MNKRVLTHCCVDFIKCFSMVSLVSSLAAQTSYVAYTPADSYRLEFAFANPLYHLHPEVCKRHQGHTLPSFLV